MSYEWDPIKARRIHLIKFAVAWLLAILFSALPIWWLVQEASL